MHRSDCIQTCIPVDGMRSEQWLKVSAQSAVIKSNALLSWLYTILKIRGCEVVEICYNVWHIEPGISSIYKDGNIH